jgi:hypothetical protein
MKSKRVAFTTLSLLPFSDPAGTRTQGPYIKSVLLYQLSYEIITLFIAKKAGANIVAFSTGNAYANNFSQKCRKALILLT